MVTKLPLFCRVPPSEMSQYLVTNQYTISAYYVLLLISSITSLRNRVRLTD